jgi:GTP-binding protein
MLDDQLIQEMEREIPNGIPYVFISSVSQMNLDRLKDLIWQAIHLS